MGGGMDPFASAGAAFGGQQQNPMGAMGGMGGMDAMGGMNMGGMGMGGMGMGMNQNITP